MNQSFFPGYASDQDIAELRRKRELSEYLARCQIRLEFAAAVAGHPKAATHRILAYSLLDGGMRVSLEAAVCALDAAPPELADEHLSFPAGKREAA